MRGLITLRNSIGFKQIRHFFVISLGILLASNAHANAFFTPQYGTNALGRAFAGGVAFAGDAGVAFSNPAAMTRLKSAEALYTLKAINIDLSFGNRGSTATTPATLGNALPYPSGNDNDSEESRVGASVFLALPLRAKQDLWFGFSMTSPFAGAHANEPDWFGRYDNIESKLLSLNLAPVLGYRINDQVSIGGGIDFLYADGELAGAVPDPFNPGGPTPETDGFGNFTGDDWDIGFNLGFLFDLNKQTTLGLHYRSKTDLTLTGPAEADSFRGLLSPLNGTRDARLDLNLPDVLSLGVSSQLSTRWLLLAEANWFGWERLQEIRVKTESGDSIVVPLELRDSYGLSVGFEYQWSQRWRLRSGLRFDQTPTQDEFRSALIPDSDRTTLGLGASYKLTKNLRLDLAYQHLAFKDASYDRTISFFTDQPLIASEVNFRAESQLNVNILSFGLRQAF